MKGLFLSGVLLAACSGSSQLDAKSPTTSPSPALEARIKTLEAENAKYREDLEWLHAVHQQANAQQAAEDAEEPAPDAMFAVDIAPDLAAGQVDGPANACVTIIKAWDFACPYCAKASAPLEQLVKDYGGKVRVVYKNMVVHPQIAMQAHLAGCAASKQGKFPEFRHVWWDKAFTAYVSERDPAKLGMDSIMAIAKDLKLDATKFKADMASPQCQQQVEGDMAELAKWHVNATPTFFINGRSFMWDGSGDSFKSAIDDELKRVTSSGVSCADYYQKVVMDKGEKKFRSKKDGKG